MMVNFSTVVPEPKVLCTVNIPAEAFIGNSTRICVEAVTLNRKSMSPSCTRVTSVKLAPRNVTQPLGSASTGSNDSITGARVTVSTSELVPKPNGLVTFTVPLTALAGKVKSSCCGEGLLCPAALAPPICTPLICRKLTPRRVTFIPGAATRGQSSVITGARVIVNGSAVTAWPRWELTVIFPLRAAGTLALIWVSATISNEARTLPKRTTVTGLKFTPRMTTESPGAPTSESRWSMTGPGPATTNDSVLVPDSSCATLIKPSVKPAGTTARICVDAVTVKLAKRSPNLTTVTPVKFCPSIVTIVPCQPRTGRNPVIRGATTNATGKVISPIKVDSFGRAVVAASGTVA